MLFKMSAQDFELIYEKYKNLLFRIAFTVVKNCEDAEDILQEVFVKRVYQAPNFESEEHEKRWLIRVTVNLCKNHVKSFWYRNKTHLEEIESAEHWNLDSEEKLLLQEIMLLPEKNRVAIYLHYFEGYTCKEIAQMLGSRESTVKMRLKKARELLKLKMEEQSNEG